MVDCYNAKMSGSDEESEPQPQGLSKAELRRNNKPIMEKRRRARINQCLDELKSLILEAMKKDPTRHSKLEKADILEMTVKHLQTIQRQQLNTAVATDPAVLTKFRSGFSECATEVSRYVNHLENVDPAVKQRLVSHLNSCVNNLQQVSPFYSHYVPYMPERLYPEIKVGFQSVDFQNGDENNNDGARIQIPSGVPLIPSRLVTGELALLVPQSAGLSAKYPFFPPAPDSAKLPPTSAFTSVKRPHSPLVSPTTSTSSFDDVQPTEPCSPGPQKRFKVPDLKTSQETQKAQVSSTSDSNSPAPSFQGKSEKVVEESLEKLRQPLSVITEKAYNSRTLGAGRKEGLKRHHSEGLLTISEKRPRFNDGSGGSGGLGSTGKGSFGSAEDLSGRASSSSGRPERRYEEQFVGGGGSVVNNDMWRPW